MTPAEHEQKIRAMFREEALEHFEAIQRALYAADATPTAAMEQLQVALRAAHSLKGAARLTGMLELEAIVHNWESCASLLLTDKLDLDHHALELLERLLETAREELESHFGAAARRLSPLDVFAEVNGHFGRHCELKAPTARVLPSVPMVIEQKSGTIRVATHKLDRQMASIEELLRLKVATELRLAELGRLVTSLGHWQSALAECRQLTRQKRSGQKPSDPETQRVVALLEDQWKWAERAGSEATQLQVELRRTSDTLASTTETLRDDVRAVRMLPVDDVLIPFVRMVRELGRTTGKNVALKVLGGDTEVDRDVLESIKDPLMHLLRNSVDHGIEAPAERTELGKRAQAELSLHARSRAGLLEIEISDDGRGISRRDVERAAQRRGLVTSEQLSRMDDTAVRALIFEDGFSTTEQVSELSGRGVGLAVARAAVEKLGGRIALRSDEGKGTSFTLLLPLTLATSRLLLVRAGGELFALPTAAVERVIRVQLAELTRIDRGHACDVDGRPVQVFQLGEALQVPEGAPTVERMFGVVLAGTTGRAVCLVDSVLDEQELVTRGLGDHLRAVTNVSGVAVLADGRVVPVLSAADLLKNAHSMAEAPVRSAAHEQQQAKRILVVDDSVTTRTLEKSILEAAGYEVQVAVDGAEAFDRLSRGSFDLVLSDVQMPRLDGLGLARAIKQDTRLKHLPVVLVSSLDSNEQRKAGLDAGADAYISKQEFEQGLLLATLERFL